MTNGSEADADSLYVKLFSSNESKAAAFDQLANLYYRKNFGTAPKAEIDLLMFSVLLDRAYEQGLDTNAVSDYSLAKELGITQARIRSLKDRKELKYPSDYDWKAEFLAIVEKAECENDRIKLFIRDSRLYTELCNVIEMQGSYAEASLTRRLLVVSPLTFLDVMMAAMPDIDAVKARKQLNEIITKNGQDANYAVDEELSFSECVKDITSEVLTKILEDAVSQVPFAGKSLADSIPRIRGVIGAWIKRRHIAKGNVD